MWSSSLDGISTKQMSEFDNSGLKSRVIVMSLVHGSRDSPAAHILLSQALFMNYSQLESSHLNAAKYCSVTYGAFP